MDHPLPTPAHPRSLQGKLRILLTVFFSIPVLEGIFFLGSFLASPSETKNIFLFGFSLQRLATLMGLILGILGFVTLIGSCWVKPGKIASWWERLSQEGAQKKFLAILAALFFLAGLAYFFPVDPKVSFSGYYEKFRPFILWVFLIVAQFLTGCIVGWKRKELRFSQLWETEKSLFRVSLIAFASFIVLATGIAITRIGINPDDRYWNEAGVPVLVFQILLALGLSILFGVLFFSKPRAKKGFLGSWKFDLMICLLLWLAAAVLWSQTPMPKSYFATAPRGPNEVTYPYSDAQTLDTGAQYVLIGQGVNNSQYHDKPFYMLFLAILHIFAGQAYLPVVQLQAACLAVFPALLYLLGKSIHSRTAGGLAALLLIFQQTNAIAATLQIQVSHSRLMLTEFPTAVGIALLSLILANWLKHPRSSLTPALLAGGILGSLLLVRTNPLVLVPVVIALFWLIYRRDLKKWFATSGLFVLGIVLVIGPWFIVGRTAEGKPFIVEKIGAVFQTRYDENIPDPNFSLLDPASSTPSPANTPVPTAQPKPDNLPSPANASRLEKALQFVPAHFAHNLAMVTLMLPASVSDDVRYLDQLLKAPYWKVTWNGNLSAENDVFLILNLLLLAIGIGAAWKCARSVGLIPLFMLIGYYLSNALGRTSGSRYLVPTDWVVWFYFSIGLIQVIVWIAALLGRRFEAPVSLEPDGTPTSSKGSTIRAGVITSLALLSLGFSIFLIGYLFPLRYAPETQDQLVKDTLARGSLQKSGISEQQVFDMLKSPTTIIFRGRALYPRYYRIDEGELSSHTVHVPRSYPHLIFNLLGQTTSWVSLPLQHVMDHFPDAADVTVIGCISELAVNAQAIIVEGSPDVVYLREPIGKWQCPQPDPVCVDNNYCK